MNLVKTKIRNIVDGIKSTIEECDIKFIKRKNKDKTKQLSFGDIIYTSANLLHSSSYSISNSKLKINGQKKYPIKQLIKDEKI